MLQGACIDADILLAGETLFLFPAVPDYVYASRFPRKSVYTGCYEKKHFRIAEANKTPEWQTEPPKPTDSIECQVIYYAKLIWCWEHSKKMIDQTYFVIARGSGSHVDVYENKELKGMMGCFPIHWFENFNLVEQETEMEKTEIASDQVVEEDIFDEPEQPRFFEQMKLF
ncbi:hypothetical protein [Domibacillus iocasae]|uniref:Uncharacterized protein n=1 Tax=Domibacillus iocasae TaxID=1714016 RepID=A0A1E7DTK6_9BACI|nr:hypothetical protein [Domibacillus iocasae]OES46018.1 hypothetical protein BA724_16770 [Domibacillus iocasae]